MYSAVEQAMRSCTVGGNVSSRSSHQLVCASEMCTVLAAVGASNNININKDEIQRRRVSGGIPSILKLKIYVLTRFFKHQQQQPRKHRSVNIACGSLWHRQQSRLSDQGLPLHGNRSSGLEQCFSECAHGRLRRKAAGLGSRVTRAYSMSCSTNHRIKTMFCFDVKMLVSARFGSADCPLPMCWSRQRATT